MKLTIGQIIDNIEKNGYPKIAKMYIQVDPDGNISGCALGQAALNLDISPFSLNAALRKQGFPTLANSIFALNDASSLTLPQIAARLRERYSGYLEDTVEIENLASLSNQVNSLKESAKLVNRKVVM